MFASMNMYVKKFSICDSKEEKFPWELNVEERIKLAEQRKGHGNTLFKDGKISEAMENYSCGLKLLIPIYKPEDVKLETINALKKSFYLNISACQLKVKQFDFVVTNCTKVLDIDQNNVKALYRRAVAYTELNSLEATERDIMKGLVMDKKNTALKKQLKIVQMKICKQNQKDSDVMKSYLKELSSNGNDASLDT